MADAIQAPQDASPETQDILKELEAEGAGSPEGNDSNTPEKEEIPEAMPEEKPPEKSEPAPEKKNETDGEPKPEKPKAPEREPKFVPVGKHNEERHKRQEAEARAAEAEKKAADLEAQIAANTSKPADDVDARSARLAEKLGIEPELAKAIITETVQPNALSEELQAELKTAKEYRLKAEARERELNDEVFFNRDFDALAKEFPELANRKEELKELAYSEGKNHIPLRDLAIVYMHDNPTRPGRKTAESPVPMKKDAEGNGVLDYENITEEQLDAMDGDEFDKYLAWQKSKDR
jgi:hypothetical protein